MKDLTKVDGVQKEVSTQLMTVGPNLTTCLNKAIWNRVPFSHCYFGPEETKVGHYNWKWSMVFFWG